MMNISSSKRGMTMIELVSALMLFIFILGGLTMALNKVTTLWSSSHTKQTEQEKAELILTMLTDDLRQVVSDNGKALDQSDETPPAFICDGSTNQTTGVKTLLQFVRLSPDNRKTNLASEKPPFLDAIFYTFYNNMLFRHVVPLQYTSDPPEPIGGLLEQAYNQTCTPAIHNEIINYLDDPANNPEPATSGAFSLLATEVAQPIILAGIASTHVTKDTPAPLFTEQRDSLSITTPAIYNEFKTSVLPDYIDVQIRIFNKNDWNTFLNLFNATPEEFERKEPHLGAFKSKRIFFSTTRGARLP
jgi:type II secretory pathway component PulJ